MKKTLCIIYQILKAYFLIITSFLLLGSSFFTSTIVHKELYLSPYRDIVVIFYLTISLIWVFLLVYKMVKIIFCMQPISIIMVLIPLTTLVFSRSAHQELGWEYWIGATVVLFIFTLGALVCFLLTMKKRRKRYRLDNENTTCS